MVTVYKVIVFAHILGMLIWIGSAITLEIIESQALNGENRERMAALLRRGELFGKRVFAPASLTTLFTGIILVAVGRATFGQVWVILALIGVVAAVSVGAGMIGRTMLRLLKKLESGASEEIIAPEFHALKAYNYIDLSLLIFVLFDMVMKPTGVDPVFVTVVVLYALGVAGLVVRSRAAARVAVHS